MSYNLFCTSLINIFILQLTMLPARILEGYSSSSWIPGVFLSDLFAMIAAVAVRSYSWSGYRTDISAVFTGEFPIYGINDQHDRTIFYREKQATPWIDKISLQCERQIEMVRSYDLKKKQQNSKINCKRTNVLI